MSLTSLKLTISIFALCGITLLAQSPAAGPRTVHPTEKSKTHTPAIMPAGLSTIYSNLGPSTDAYNDGFAQVVSGSASIIGFSLAYALPFTPKTDAQVREVMAALSYGGVGANQVNLSLYSDSDGVPGSILAGPWTVMNLPSIGTCCTLSEWTLSSPLAVTAGTQYWIVVDTPATGTGDSFYGVWDFISPTPFVEASNTSGTVWAQQKTGFYQPAAGVFGTTQ